MRHAVSRLLTKVLTGVVKLSIVLPKWPRSALLLKAAGNFKMVRDVFSLLFLYKDCVGRCGFTQLQIAIAYFAEIVEAAVGTVQAKRAKKC